MIQPAARSFGNALLRRSEHLGLSPFSLRSSTLTIRSLASLAEEEPYHCSHSLLILGKPGGGKGTISGKILHDFPQFRHVSTGDELRQHVRNGTELGIEAKKYMDGMFLVCVYGYVVLGCFEFGACHEYLSRHTISNSTSYQYSL